MLAEKNESIAEATETVYKLSEEEMILLQCEAREDYYRRQRDAEILRERQERRMQENERQMQEQERQMQVLKTENEKLLEQNRLLIAENERLRTERGDGVDTNSNL